MLRRQYPPESAFRTGPGNWRESIAVLESMPEGALRALRVVHGHMGFGVHRLFPQPARYVTLVCDPVARIASHYAHVLRTPNHYLYEQVTAERLTLLEYACSGLMSTPPPRSESGTPSTSSYTGTAARCSPGRSRPAAPSSSASCGASGG